MRFPLPDLFLPPKPLSWIQTWNIDLNKKMKVILKTKAKHWNNIIDQKSKIPLNKLSVYKPLRIETPD